MKIEARPKLIKLIERISAIKEDLGDGGIAQTDITD